MSKKRPLTEHFLLINSVADPTRLELATSAVTGQRSNQLSYESTYLSIIPYFVNKSKVYIPGILKAEGSGAAEGGGVVGVDESAGTGVGKLGMDASGAGVEGVVGVEVGVTDGDKLSLAEVGDAEAIGSIVADSGEDILIGGVGGGGNISSPGNGM